MFTPRLIRAKDAPYYLGMPKEEFYAKARPYLTQVKTGKQARAYDREELDQVAEMLKKTQGIPPVLQINRAVRQIQPKPITKTDKRLEELLASG